MKDMHTEEGTPSTHTQYARNTNIQANIQGCVGGHYIDSLVHCNTASQIHLL